MFYFLLSFESPANKKTRLLGVNKNVVPRIDLQSELVPQPYVASRDDGILQTNVKTSLDLLGVPAGRRDFVLVCDETCWYATCDLISGLRSTMGYVGGFYDPEQDFSFMDLDEMKESTEDQLARLTQHYMVTRCDTNSHTWCIDMLPRPPKSAGIETNGALRTFMEMGNCLLNACRANDGVPPIGVAYDAGTAHALINRALMGLLSTETLAKASFFNQCKVGRVRFPCFSFGVLLFQDKHVILGCLDVLHASKRFAYHLATAASVTPALECNRYVMIRVYIYTYRLTWF